MSTVRHSPFLPQEDLQRLYIRCRRAPTSASNLRGPSPCSGVRGHGLLNSASRVFLFKADFVTLDTEPNTGMDLDSEVANIPVGP